MRTIFRAFCIFIILFSLGSASFFGAEPFTSSTQTSTAQGSITLSFHGPLSEQSIVLQEENASFSLTVDTPFAEHTLQFAYTIYDRDGTELRYHEETWELSSGSDVFTYALHDVQPGWYRIVYELYQPVHRQTLLREHRDFVVLHGRDGDRREDTVAYGNVFGLQNSRLNPEEARIIYELGADWLLDAATPSWAETQLHAGGQYVFHMRDGERALAKQYNLHALGSIGDIPAWVQGDDAYAALRNDYYKFVQAYPHNNERMRYVITKPMTVDAFASSLHSVQMKLTTAALQDEEPTQTGQNIVALQYDDLSDAHRLWRDGMQYHTDALFIQLPPLQAAPEQFPWEGLKSFQRQWHQAGGYAQLWTMLPNASLYEEADPSPSLSTQTTFRLFNTPTPNGTETNSDRLPGYDAKLQEQWLVRSHILQLAHGVDRIFSGPLSTGEGERRLYSGGAGAFPDMPQRPRPALAAYATLTEQLGEATYLGQLALGHDIYAYLFSRHGRLTLAVWTTRASTTFELSNLHTNEVTIVDLLGAKQLTPVQNGRLEIQLNESPQYIVGLDASVFAQVLIDSYTKRIASLGELYPALRHDVEQAIDEIRQLATEVWLHSAGLADAETAYGAWEQSVRRFITLGEHIIGDGRETAETSSVLFSVFEMWPVLAEIGVQLQIEQPDVSQQEQRVGTDVIVEEAIDGLLAPQQPYAARYDVTDALLRMVQMWWHKAQQHPDDVPDAWAMMTREAIGLIALLRDDETPRLHNVFITPERDVIYIEDAANSTVSLSALFHSVWESVFRIAQDQQLPLIDFAQKALQVDLRQQHSSKDKWFVVPAHVKIMNMSEHDMEAQLSIDLPDGWLAQVKDNLVIAGKQPSSFPVKAASRQDTVAEIRLFIPVQEAWDAQDVRIEFDTLTSKADQTHVTLRREAE